MLDFEAYRTLHFSNMELKDLGAISQSHICLHCCIIKVNIAFWKNSNTLIKYQ